MKFIKKKVEVRGKKHSHSRAKARIFNEEI